LDANRWNFCRCRIPDIRGYGNATGAAHYQYQKGFVLQEFWEMTRGNLKRQMRNPVANAIVMEKIDRGVRPGFQDVLLEINEEIETQLDE